MTLKLKGALAALLALMFASGAYAAPHFADVTVSDSDDGDATETFAPNTPKIFVHAGLVDVTHGSKVSSDWIAEDTGGAAPANFKIDSVTLDTGMLTNVVTFSLSKPNAGWPVGRYRVDLLIDDKAAGAAHFKVSKEAGND
jgi:hypothetical protein